MRVRFPLPAPNYLIVAPLLSNPMDQKQAIQILIKILEKYQLDDTEKKALTTAIGILGWTSLAEGRRKAIKEKKHKI